MTPAGKFCIVAVGMFELFNSSLRAQEGLRCWEVRRPSGEPGYTCFLPDPQRPGPSVNSVTSTTSSPSTLPPAPPSPDLPPAITPRPPAAPPVASSPAATAPIPSPVASPPAIPPSAPPQPTVSARPPATTPTASSPVVTTPPPSPVAPPPTTPPSPPQPTITARPPATAPTALPPVVTAPTPSPVASPPATPPSPPQSTVTERPPSAAPPVASSPVVMTPAPSSVAPPPVASTRIEASLASGEAREKVRREFYNGLINYVRGQDILWGRLKGQNFAAAYRAASRPKALAVCIDWRTSTPSRLDSLGKNKFQFVTGDNNECAPKTTREAVACVIRDCRQYTGCDDGTTCTLIDVNNSNALSLPASWVRRYSR
jgi:hypothetical protein